MEDKISVNEIVYFTHHDGKKYEGVVKSIDVTSKGTLVTVLTPERGYRTARLESCKLLSSLDQ